jgi:hypothetical protein
LLLSLCFYLAFTCPPGRRPHRARPFTGEGRPPRHIAPHERDAPSPAAAGFLPAEGAHQKSGFDNGFSKLCDYAQRSILPLATRSAHDIRQKEYNTGSLWAQLQHDVILLDRLCSGDPTSRLENREGRKLKSHSFRSSRARYSVAIRLPDRK